MLRCCKNKYNYCDAFIGCPECILIRVPYGYVQETIIIRVIRNRDTAYEFEVSIDQDLFATICAIGTLKNWPEGFINPYGSSYEIQFLDATTTGVIEFTMGGVTYDGINLPIIAGNAAQPNFIIDLFPPEL